MLASALWREWAVDPASTLTAILALLWWQGGRGVHAAQGRRRTAAFWGGIFTLVVALNSPLDVEADHFSGLSVAGADEGVDLVESAAEID